MKPPQEKHRSRMLRWVVLVLFPALFLAGCNRDDMVQEEVDLGFSGEARVNPFLAAERFLRVKGLKATRQFSLTELPAHDVVMVVPRSAIVGPNDAWRVLEWAGQGGHLIYVYTDHHNLTASWNAAAKNEDDEEEKETGGGSGEAVPEDHLLSWLQIAVTKREKWTRSLHLNGRLLEVNVPKGPGFGIPRDWLHQDETARAGSEGDGYSFASFPYEKGRLTLLADAYPWQNRYVGEGDHADFLWEVVTMKPGSAAVWLLRSTQTSFWVLLWKYGWMPLLSLMAFVIFWLWRGMPRFGPMLPAPEAAPRQFAAHLAMTGGFLWKYGSINPLLEPLRRRIRRRHQTNSLVTGKSAPEEIFEALAKSSGLPLERVRQAMESKTVKRPDRLAGILRDLQKIDLTQ